MAEQQNKSEYNAEQIQILEGLEAVRKRPGMYIGSTSAPGLHHLVYEIVDNSIDEALAGYGKEINVKIHEDNSITVIDHGRGIPVDIHPKQGIPTVEVVLTILHAGGKFGGGGYKVSGGLHGVGMSVVNALSTELVVEIKRNGKIYRQRYERGKTVTPLEIVGEVDENDTGTTIHFIPDEEIFKEGIVFDFNILKQRLRELAFLNKGLLITLEDLRDGRREEYFQEGGIIDYVRFTDTNKEPVNPNVIYFAKEKDGVQVEIVANIGKPEDVDKVLQYDGEGVGLFRTEFLFMDRTAMPTEEEQFEAYKKVAIALNGKPVIIRTLDIGGDKEIPYMGLEKDENPFLGYRAIRLCLDRKEDIYKPQLRALLRASAYGNIRIMIPLVTCIDELREAKALIEEIKAELDEKNIAYKKDIQVGIMVETAAASLIADIFAKEADFFSIGTNDLTQYTMSVDRGNKKVSYLYSTFNPAVLRSIRHIIACGREAGIMVGMCGEAASDPMMIPLLLAFGLNEFSMSASAILRARKMVTEYSVEELQAVADKAMSFATTAEVEDYMRKFVEKITG